MKITIPIRRGAVRLMKIGDSMVTTIRPESSSSVFCRAGMFCTYKNSKLIVGDRLVDVTIITFVSVSDEASYDALKNKKKGGRKKGQKFPGGYKKKHAIEGEA